MEWQNWIEDQSNDNVSGRERTPNAVAAIPGTPATRKEQNPAGEDVVIIWVIADSEEGDCGCETAEENTGDGTARWHLNVSGASGAISARLSLSFCVYALLTLRKVKSIERLLWNLPCLCCVTQRPNFGDFFRMFRV